MIKQFATVVAMITFLFEGGTGAANPQEPKMVGKVPVVEQVIEVEVNFAADYMDYVETNDINLVISLMSQCEEEMTHAHNMAEAARGLGYPEDHPIILLAKEEYLDAQEHYLRYKEKYNELGWGIKAEEYPEATQIWLYLKSLDYNDYICAGILGNIMAEVGGNTLKIRPLIFNKDKTFYGMCQWSMKYYSEVRNATLAEQCDFLANNIEKEIDTFGRKYKVGFKYDDFVELTSYKEAALAFAKSYERCASQYYNVRVENAAKAYQYFVE